MRTPIVPGQGEAEAAHRGAEEAERRAGRDARVELGPARRRLLDEDGVGRQALGQRGENVAGAQRLAGLRRRRAARAWRTARAAGRRARRQPLDQAAADRARLGQEGELRRAAVRLGGVVGDEREARARVDERAGLVGVLAEDRRADGEDRVVGGERLAQPRAAGGKVAGEERVVLREARAGAEGLGAHRARQALGERDERGPALRRVGAGADDERGRLGRRRAARRAPRSPRGRRRRRAAARPGPPARGARARARASRPSAR